MNNIDFISLCRRYRLAILSFLGFVKPLSRRGFARPVTKVSETVRRGFAVTLPASPPIR